MVETAYSDVRQSLLRSSASAERCILMLLKVRPRILSGYCQYVVTCGQWSLVRCWVDQKKLSRLGQMMSFPTRLPMCHAIVSIGPSLLIWFQLENLNMVVNVIWEYIYRIQREVNWQKIFKMVRRAGRRQETTNMRPKVIIRASKVIIEVGAYDELPSDVFNLPDESEYRCCLADMVPAGWLKRGGVCDKGVNTDRIRREVDLQKMFKTERQAGRR